MRGKRLTAELVAFAYHLMLGRAPENSEVVNSKQDNSIESLRDEFINSYEFRIRNRAVLTPSFEGSNQSGTADLILDEQINKVINQWTFLGESNPYWSVLSSEEYDGDLTAKDKATFFHSGEVIVNQFLDLLKKRNITLRDNAQVLELGCGVGRLTKTLAERFDSVTALDISPGNIQEAKNELNTYSNINFELIDSLESVRQLSGNFDVFISLITLQHNPPQIQKIFLENIFLKFQKVGCILYFQLVTHIDGDSNVSETGDGEKISFETFAFPMHEVLDLIHKYEFNIFEIYRDDWQLDPRFHSYSFYLKKLKSCT